MKIPTKWPFGCLTDKPAYLQKKNARLSSDIFGQVLPQTSHILICYAPCISNHKLVGYKLYSKIHSYPYPHIAPILSLLYPYSTLFYPYSYISHEISPYQFFPATPPSNLVVPVLHRQLVPLHVDGCKAIVLTTTNRR